MKKTFLQMFSTLLFLFFFVPISYGMCSDNLEDDFLKDLPVAQLSEKAMSKFKPQILELLESTCIHLQDSNRTKRKTIEYGYGFLRMVNKDFSYKAPPKFILDLGDAVCDALGETRVNFTNFIISLYDPGYQIEPHFDTDEDHLKEYGFYFDEKVFGVVIDPDPTGSIYFTRYEGADLHPPADIQPRYPVKEEEGTVFVLKGKYRYKPIYHGVSEISKRRISVTFRVVKRQ